VLTVIFVAIRAVRPICVRSLVSVLLAHRVCVHILLSVCLFLSLARSLVDCGRRSARCDQQWAAENWTDRRRVSSNNSFCARRATLEHNYFIFHDAEKYLKRRSPLLRDGPMWCGITVMRSIKVYMIMSVSVYSNST